MAVRYHVIGAGELDASLIGAWRDIQAGAPAFASPYFAPEFTQAAAAVRDDVGIAVIEDDGRPAGFFPFQRSALGGAKPVGGPLSDYHGVIAKEGGAWDLPSLLRSAGIAVWTFDHLVGHAGRFDPYVGARARSPQMDLSGGYEAYAKGRRAAGSDYIRKTEGLARKMGREVGELEFTYHDASGEILRTLIAWKRAQYLSSGLVDVFGAAWTVELLRRIQQASSPDFAGVCSSLRAGGKTVAIHMGMRSRGVLHYWFPAYDPQFAKFSPGIYLLLKIAEAAAGAGVGAIDLGKGDAQYKERLMTGAVELREGAVELPSVRAFARRVRRAAEAGVARGGLGRALSLPLRALRRFERMRRFR